MGYTDRRGMKASDWWHGRVEVPDEVLSGGGAPIINGHAYWTVLIKQPEGFYTTDSLFNKRPGEVVQVVAEAKGDELYALSGGQYVETLCVRVRAKGEMMLCPPKYLYPDREQADERNRALAKEPA